MVASSPSCSAFDDDFLFSLERRCVGRIPATRHGNGGHVSACSRAPSGSPPGPTFPPLVRVWAGEGLWTSLRARASRYTGYTHSKPNPGRGTRHDNGHASPTRTQTKASPATHAKHANGSPPEVTSQTHQSVRQRSTDRAGAHARRGAPRRAERPANAPSRRTECAQKSLGDRASHSSAGRPRACTPRGRWPAPT